jgi:hypothetical protein
MIEQFDFIGMVRTRQMKRNFLEDGDGFEGPG